MLHLHLDSGNAQPKVVTLANQQLLDLNPDSWWCCINWPSNWVIGCSDIISLLTALALKNLKIGAASICKGGGGASAIILERDPEYRKSLHTMIRVCLRTEIT